MILSIKRPQLVLHGFYFNGANATSRTLKGIGLEFLFKRVQHLMLENVEFCQDASDDFSMLNSDESLATVWIGNGNAIKTTKFAPKICFPKSIEFTDQIK